MKDIYYKYNIFYIGLILLFFMNLLLGVFVYINRGCYATVDRVAFLDIGQGDAIYIENKAGQTILIDTGNKDYKKQIEKIKMCNKVHIDSLILTHPDQDHIGEATNLIQKGYVNQVIHNGFLNINQQQESQTENDLEKIIKKKNIKTQDIVLNPGLDFKNFNINFLHPSTTPYMDKKGKSKSVDDNDYSIIFKLSHIKSDTSFMLTGDAPIKVEKQIIETYCLEHKTSDICPMLKSTVLKLGHHGSKNSSGIDFLKKVDAIDYIVSAGLNNKYNHPNEETLYRVYLNKKDSRIRETALEGNVVYILE